MYPLINSSTTISNSSAAKFPLNSNVVIRSLIKRGLYLVILNYTNYTRVQACAIDLLVDVYLSRFLSLLKDLRCTFCFDKLTVYNVHLFLKGNNIWLKSFDFNELNQTNSRLFLKNSNPDLFSQRVDNILDEQADANPQNFFQSIMDQFENKFLLAQDICKNDQVPNTIKKRRPNSSYLKAQSAKSLKRFIKIRRIVSNPRPQENPNEKFENKCFEELEQYFQLNNPVQTFAMFNAKASLMPIEANIDTIASANNIYSKQTSIIDKIYNELVLTKYSAYLNYTETGLLLKEDEIQERELKDGDLAIADESIVKTSHKHKSLLVYNGVDFTQDEIKDIRIKLNKCDVIKINAKTKKEQEVISLETPPYVADIGGNHKNGTNTNKIFDKVAFPIYTENPKEKNKIKLKFKLPSKNNLNSENTSPKTPESNMMPKSKINDSKNKLKIKLISKTKDQSDPIVNTSASIPSVSIIESPPKNNKLNPIELLAPFQPDERINCVCSMPYTDDGSFMISCDKCHEWFHGRCVDVSTSTDNIPSTWLCIRCKRNLGTINKHVIDEKKPTKFPKIKLSLK